jgi:hypothetical protein
MRGSFSGDDQLYCGQSGLPVWDIDSGCRKLEPRIGVSQTRNQGMG